MPIRPLDAPRALDVQQVDVGPPRQALALATASERGLGAAARAGGTADFRRRAVIECLGTLGTLRSAREPLAGETWQTPLASERRLLAQVDAIVGLGPTALAQAVDLALDPDVPDPARVFASLFVLGSVDGPGWLKPLQTLFVTATTRHPEEMSAAIEALSLGPNADLHRAMTPLLTHAEARVRAAAVRVLSFRGALAAGDWQAALADPSPGVAAAAAWAPMPRLPLGQAEAALAPLLHSPHEPIAIPVLRAGLGHRLRIAYRRAAELAEDRPGWADALNLLAMFGFASDAERIAAALVSPAPLPALRAAGTLGHIALVPDLIAALERPGLAPADAAEARMSLWKIAGIALADGQGASVARTLWERRAAHFSPHLRYRGGRPLNPAVLVALLRSGPVQRLARQEVYLELGAATASAAPRFSAYDFVAVQAGSLDRLEAWCASPDGQAATTEALH
ncbi:hypothetical protein [Piscinibacter gummiphilus]|uniref:Uncharacterized protein n=1 Tax=Piscinibacter gummiphilus TaxID=946333 RepID=A0A1W6L930_9BURK|nr:hypothetical protein [Piscinibacter gummiphilus]ARN20668.1 hypothetical protein A4W93_12605 [Piscinibacter gummiphilus]ATU65343.1 hypothetical protein CPZ87_12680 [Piscinibacter gummiphilus]GLS94489.1 hypothetical protein GCM10007918_17810 [Piscinibacter gummiphilus]